LPDRLDLYLSICPGDEETRTRLFNTARDNPTVFQNSSDSLEGETPIFLRTILEPEFHEDATDAEREAEIRKNWADFLENDLPRIDDALKQERWIWESSDTDDEETSSRSENVGWSDGDIETKHPYEDPEESEN